MQKMLQPEIGGFTIIIFFTVKCDSTKALSKAAILSILKLICNEDSKQMVFFFFKRIEGSIELFCVLKECDFCLSGYGYI